MEKLTISVALTTYNGMPYLKQQLQSIENQSLRPDEIVIHDDISSDKTYEFLTEFCAQSTLNIKLKKNHENIGYNLNFSKTLKECSGEFIFICDQDDIWHSNKISFVMDFFKKNPSTDLVIHDLEICDGSMNLINERKIERIKSIADPMDCYCTGMATAIRKNFLDLCIEDYDPKINYDNWLHSCATLLGTKKIIDTPLANYRRHSSAATSKTLVNSPKKNSKLKTMLYTAQGSTSEYLDYEIAKTDKLLAWANKIMPYLSDNKNYKSTLKHSSIDSVKKKSLRFKRRKEVIESKGLTRLSRAIQVYCSGGYQEFNGLKSCIKDIIIAN
ncbi:putative protein [BD1-7 clade bacterium]|uniref:Glycosyltransferase 2-like domain-containing protein n=1 Tax=BD1-7 clade bacterium TaxID=2029982 RepID=A0A5S9N1X5_9GAMM|nr:putative protein [BD1-7 clade bacterium]CAA0083208.1 putative protein [BD1-7 clade bacterium]